MGGKPSQGTKKDQRLAANKGRPAKPDPKPSQRKGQK